ncbi:hypothetical protein ACLI4U_01985 [Natrialbaceae archaeon A-CW2]|uniref:DUF7389 domain-containing protein n=1 Tax=Natronosalvus amylolyticus TaxID=2961994 RepID=UPI0020C9E51A|nr:hypothetical protein [Natronosalvus amylolyticus]
MSPNVTEMENGNISVRIKSRRGTGTRDEDEVIVQAVYSDLDEAENESHRLNQLLEKRMQDARTVKNAEEQDNDSDITSPEPSEPEVSKVYLGNGSRLGGWIPVPKQIVFNKIAPLVSKNSVENSEIPGIKINFSKDVPTSGWTEVDADVISNEIEPLVRNYRLDKD